MTTSHSRGWAIFHDGNIWRYSDDGSVFDDSRPCARCGRMPTEDGFDACLGRIPGAVSACCGHGIEPGYILMGGERT